MWFERTLALLVLPVLALSIPLLLNFFSAHNRTGLLLAYGTCLLQTFVVWLGCRRVYLYLRFQHRHPLPYPRFLAGYSLFAFGYSFGVSFAAFFVLQQWLPLPLPVSALALLTALVAFFISAAYEIVLLHEEGTHERLKNVQLQKSKLQTELNSLKARIEPHFLFNSLNTLQNLITEDKALANQFNLTLSETYQQVIDMADKDFVLLQTDIDMMYRYYQLVSIRFPGALQLVLHINSFNTAQARLPPLSLQLLLENALKHNSFSAQCPLRLRLCVSDTSAVFSNNKTKAVRQWQASGQGLKILSDRFWMLQQQRIEIDNDTDFFSVTLPLKTSI